MSGCTCGGALVGNLTRTDIGAVRHEVYNIQGLYFGMAEKQHVVNEYTWNLFVVITAIIISLHRQFTV